jgi:hypothetical protein
MHLLQKRKLQLWLNKKLKSKLPLKPKFKLN